MADYKEKYLKYKNKYLTLQAQLEGGGDCKQLKEKLNKIDFKQIKDFIVQKCHGDTCTKDDLCTIATHLDESQYDVFSNFIKGMVQEIGVDTTENQNKILNFLKEEAIKIGNKTSYILTFIDLYNQFLNHTICLMETSKAGRSINEYNFFNYLITDYNIIYEYLNHTDNTKYNKVALFAYYIKEKQNVFQQLAQSIRNPTGTITLNEGECKTK